MTTVRNSPADPLHPSPEDFEDFLRDPPRPGAAERNALIVRHLLAGCAVCQQVLRDLAAEPALPRILEIPLSGKGENPGEPASHYNYDWAFARAERAFATLLARDRVPEKLPEFLEEISGLSESEQIRRFTKRRDVADPGIVEYLLDCSHAVRFESPSKMLHFARLAHLAAEACPPERAGDAEQLADLRAESWGQLANALRVNGRLQEAEDAFASSLHQWEAGTRSLRLRGRMLSRLTALRSFQRQFTAALETADEAEEIFRQLGDSHLQGGALIKKAIATLYSGNPEGAIEILYRATSMIDRVEDPLLFLVAHHNLALCYIDVGQPEEALAIHYQARDLYRDHSDPLILLRAVWQEGVLLREIGHLHNAEAALLRARQGFLEAGLAYEAAMVSLDLAEVYKKAGLTDKLRRTIAEALPILKALRVSRDTLAALLQLQEAAQPEPNEEPAQQKS